MYLLFITSIYHFYPSLTMQFTALLLTIVASASAIELAVLSALLSDLQAHSAEYLSYVAANPAAYPASLIALANSAKGQTDLSPFTDKFPTAEYESFITGFPGYARVSSETAAAGKAGGASSGAASSGAASSGAASSAAPSSGAASSAASSGAASSAAGSADAPAASSSVAIISNNSANGLVGQNGKLVLLPVVAVSSLFLAALL